MHMPPCFRKRVGSCLKIDVVKHVPALTITAVNHLSEQLRQAAALKEDFEMSEALRHMTLQVNNGDDGELIVPFSVQLPPS